MQFKNKYNIFYKAAVEPVKLSMRVLYNINNICLLPERQSIVILKCEAHD